jgi:hypothetical protein
MLEFLKSRSNFKVRKSKIMVPNKIKNTYTKYESPITYHSKDKANVKVFKK